MGERFVFDQWVKLRSSLESLTLVPPADCDQETEAGTWFDPETLTLDRALCTQPSAGSPSVWSHFLLQIIWISAPSGCWATRYWDCYNLWHFYILKARKLHESEQRADRFKWEASTFFLCGPGLYVDIYLTCHVIAGHAKQPGHPYCRLQGYVWTPCHTYTALIHLCNNCSDLCEFSLPCFKIYAQNVGDLEKKQALIKQSIMALSFSQHIIF